MLRKKKLSIVCKWHGSTILIYKTNQNSSKIKIIGEKRGEKVKGRVRESCGKEGRKGMGRGAPGRREVRRLGSKSRMEKKLGKDRIKEEKVEDGRSRVSMGLL
jgi:hypothetical protein